MRRRLSLTQDDFREASTYLNAKIWFDEVKERTGIQKTFALARELDPTSVRISLDNVPRVSKWYKYQKHQSLPNKTLVKKIKLSIPNLQSDPQHPAWTIIKNHPLSAVTLRHSIRRMHAEWRLLLVYLKALPLHLIRLDAEFVKLLLLGCRNYLDAFMLLEIARRHHLNITNNLFTAISFTLLIQQLPLIFLNDSFWKYTKESSRSFALFFLISIMRPSSFFSTSMILPSQNILKVMRLQQKLLEKELINGNHDLDKHNSQILFFAKNLEDKDLNFYRILSPGKLDIKSNRSITYFLNNKTIR
jgi:hypothetical protein